ncbi:pectate lyase [Flavisolibacter ginsenosidimutans]|uniref:Pectate lyase n=1 Tax=Flavisolibacter ginsenosidimutans TaxID=661481 RepID=A0A5B8URA1_9BACT|nr:pectate lyase [Flavisolibacter ginsenosidimutans]
MPLFTATLLLFGVTALHAQKGAKPWTPLTASKGKLSYSPDSQGNRIVDFSYCGYAASNEPIPDVPVKVVVPVSKGDATLRIQSAIDYVASLPVDKSGFRGAVLLQKGKYVVGGQLKMMASGVVLRGSGSGADGTTIIGADKDRQTLIRVFGKGDKTTSKEIAITDAYVPVNATKLSLKDASSFKEGDEVIVHRPSTAAWIKTLGTETFGGGISALGWKPGERDVYFERKIVAINNNEITLDVPLTTALDSSFGGGLLSKLSWTGRIQGIGVENLSLQSEYDVTNPKDEAHRWMAITLENIEDAWVRQVNFQHFAGSAVAVLETAKRITVEDCKSLAPVSEIGGQRRNTFFTAGQQTLFQRCYAQNGYHDFAVGFCAPGPNAFVQCQSDRPYDFSGTIDSWASGVLFDIVNVDGNAIRFGNREQDGQGAGWSAANSVLWQCTAARIDCYKPPTAQNYSFGSWAQFGGNGYWESSNEQINPRSLYYTQLAERLGKDVSKMAYILPMETDASSSPPVDVAMALTKKAYEPAPRIVNWIDDVIKMHVIPTSTSGAKTIDQIGVKSSWSVVGTPVIRIENGVLVSNGRLMTGKRSEVPWWNGSVQPKDLPQMKPHITRFVPGRTGTGLTDDLDSLTDWMQRSNTVAIEHNYGLWYERRRDDHERIRRMTGDVWPPFYELPFARSGKDSAWDGLSKYDLTKYNDWYWRRLKQFADLADRKGLVLVHQNYFQHNIIEAGAHNVDFPWRPANNINGTPFNEPVNFAGDKRIFYAEQFYNVAANPAYRKLHEAYIRKCLDNFKDNSGVIQLTSAEYTGPLHFVQFWLDVVKQWEKETGKKEIIGLSTTKDVQDAILADAARAAVVDLIDIRYWHYQDDGTTYEPKGGQNLAPRQHARLLKPKKTSFEQVYRAVSEYKQKFPAKAVMYSGDGYDQFGWAVLMAGGSMPVLPVLDKQFLADASSMKPIVDASAKGQWMMKSKNGFIVYANGKEAIQIPLAAGSYQLRYMNPQNGTMTKEEMIQGGKVVAINWPHGPVVLWVTANQKSVQHEATIQK